MTKMITKNELVLRNRDIIELSCIYRQDFRSNIKILIG